MRVCSKLRNIIINILITPNVYSLYFVISFWSKNNSTSKGTRTGTSLSILLVTQFSLLMFIDSIFGFSIWKNFFFVICVIQLGTSFFFEKKIYLVVFRFKESAFSKFYWIFIVYLLITTALFLFLTFSRNDNLSFWRRP